MAYTPAELNKYVEDCVKEIRHMDRIEHDPEAQRIKKLVFEACEKSFLLASPPEDGLTRHVTTAVGEKE